MSSSAGGGPTLTAGPGRCRDSGSGWDGCVPVGTVGEEERRPGRRPSGHWVTYSV